MPDADRDRSLLCRRALLVEVVIAIVLLAIVPFAGRMLYHQDAIEKADVLFVLAGEPAQRWLEAYDLQREGYAPRIVLSAGYREPAVDALERRGVHIPSEGELARDALIALGAPQGSVSVMPGFPDNTADEGRLFRIEARANHWTSVIVVTSKLHTRRAGFAIRRELGDTNIRVLVRASRYDDDNPSVWWMKRRTIRTVLYEFPKLVAYGLGLGA
jgi:uncharacterized SAM-binding protein YcdF (DUF218 family)